MSYIKRKKDGAGIKRFGWTSIAEAVYKWGRPGRPDELAPSGTKAACRRNQSPTETAEAALTAEAAW